MKNGCFWRGIEWLTLILFAFVALKPSTGLASEKEVILSEEYQTEKEKMYLVDNRFKTDFGFGTSYVLGATVYMLNMAMTYRINPGMGIYLVVPSYIASVLERKYLFSEEEWKSGIGDVYAGIYYQLLSGTGTMPNIIVDLDINSDTSKYFPLESENWGGWDFMFGTQVRKFIYKPFYLFGLGDYTYKVSKEEVLVTRDSPIPEGVRNMYFTSASVGYGGGIGVFLGQLAIEASLKADRPYLGGETAGAWPTGAWPYRTLTFNLALRSILSADRMAVTFYNVDKGFDWKRLSFGYSYPLQVDKPLVIALLMMWPVLVAAASVE